MCAFNLEMGIPYKLFICFALVLSHATASSIVGAYQDDCLSCVNKGYDFCTYGASGGTVTYNSGYCCSSMIAGSDTCQYGFNACTFSTANTKIFKGNYYKYVGCSMPAQGCTTLTGKSFFVDGLNTD